MYYLLCCMNIMPRVRMRSEVYGSVFVCVCLVILCERACMQ